MLSHRRLNIRVSQVNSVTVISNRSFDAVLSQWSVVIEEFRQSGVTAEFRHSVVTKEFID